ncbi:Smr/MutS family protein, partial [Castellaniella sp.]|uniref:Smr/MutS family protein n=1 Tax=Castellaniella sp. TaxID=1955812 RepID=UPI003C74680D
AERPVATPPRPRARGARQSGRPGLPASPDARKPDTPARAADDTQPALDPADQALFRQAMRFVRPLPDRGPRARAALRRVPDTLLRVRREHAQGESDTPKRPQPARQRHPAATGILDPDAQEFLQPGCGPDLLRGLRRGKWIAQATLDLHGSTQDEARERLDRFLASCLEHGIRCVRVIHGKGIGSRQGEPVLKSTIRQHLSRLEAIQAWVQGNERDGGAGAVTALLRLPQEP